MADEFIDFYEALGLPLEAGRKEVHSRMAEVYLEAQRNLDHRDLATRFKYQQLFEVILPRARYILLDDARRDEYDGLVRAFRGLPMAAPPQPELPASTEPNAEFLESLPATPTFGRGDTSGFRLAQEQFPAPAMGRAPRVAGLPAPSLSPARSAQERDEMLQKWRARLEAAIARDEQEQNAARAAPPKLPSSDTRAVAPKARVASPVSFDFGHKEAEELEEAAKQRELAQEAERTHTERKREAIKEILMGVGVKANIMGGMGTAFPLGGLLIFLMGRYYPRGAAPQLSLPSSVAWFLGLTLILAASSVVAHSLSRELRHKRALELATMPLEDILRQLGRSY